MQLGADCTDTGGVEPLTVPSRVRVLQPRVRTNVAGRDQARAFADAFDVVAESSSGFLFSENYIRGEHSSLTDELGLPVRWNADHDGFVDINGNPVTTVVIHPESVTPPPNWQDQLASGHRNAMEAERRSVTDLEALRQFQTAYGRWWDTYGRAYQEATAGSWLPMSSGGAPPAPEISAYLDADGNPVPGAGGTTGFYVQMPSTPGWSPGTTGRMQAAGLPFSAPAVVATQNAQTGSVTVRNSGTTFATPPARFTLDDLLEGTSRGVSDPSEDLMIYLGRGRSIPLRDAGYDVSPDGRLMQQNSNGQWRPAVPDEVEEIHLVPARGSQMRMEPTRSFRPGNRSENDECEPACPTNPRAVAGISAFPTFGARLFFARAANSNDCKPECPLKDSAPYRLPDVDPTYSDIMNHPCYRCPTDSTGLVTPSDPAVGSTPGDMARSDALWKATAPRLRPGFTYSYQDLDAMYFKGKMFTTCQAAAIGTRGVGGPPFRPSDCVDIDSVGRCPSNPNYELPSWAG